MFAASKTASASSGSSSANYIEDVFSTYLYTGNGSTQTITNGIDLAGKGGLVWMKDRTTAYSHILVDTVRGAANGLSSNTTNAQFTNVNSLTSFNANGFTVNSGNSVNQDTDLFASWTFRKQPKFFDVVTYTGDGTSSKTVSHSLGSAPAFIVIKRTDNVSDWFCYHTSLGVSNYIILDSTAAAVSATNVWQTPTTTTFGYNAAGFNVSGATYVAYLYASNAGGFGLTGTDNVISCGSCSGSQDVNVGFEPQYVLFKNATSAGQWLIMDSMRGFNVTNEQLLLAESSGAEFAWGGAYIAPTATGFKTSLGGTDTFIYIAIRRGPMKVPTSGTKVFGLTTTPAGTSGSYYGFYGLTNADMYLGGRNTFGDSANNWIFCDRLRGMPQTTSSTYPKLLTTSTAVEASSTAFVFDWGPSTQSAGLFAFGVGNASANTDHINYFFQRAPSFFDEVCYTGTGAARTVAHNLGVAPELIIVKDRTNVNNWAVYASSLGAGQRLLLESTSAAAATTSYWNNTAPTSSVFSVGAIGVTNASGDNYVAYLFATCAGVSKVGSYTGTGATQTISCGFTGGARFVLVKRTDDVGSWYVWDTARGMVSGTDPWLLLNSTAAENNTNSIYTTTGGFQIVSTAAGINASGGTYIYLAIA